MNSANLLLGITVLAWAALQRLNTVNAVLVRAFGRSFFLQCVLVCLLVAVHNETRHAGCCSCGCCCCCCSSCATSITHLSRLVTVSFIHGQVPTQQNGGFEEHGERCTPPPAFTSGSSAAISLAHDAPRHKLQRPRRGEHHHTSCS